MTPKQAELARRRQYEADRAACQHAHDIWEATQVRLYTGAKHAAWLDAKVREALREGWF